MTDHFSLTALRTLALHTQGLTTPLNAAPPPGPDAIAQLVEKIGCVQIDTLQMVARSQYLALWSRLGRYNPADFDQLIFGPQRRFFEGWLHAACVIPFTEYRYQYSLTEHTSNWYTCWLAETHNAAVVPAVLERIQQEGARRAADFEYNGPRRGSWWDWKPAKTALEYLFASGKLLIANRVNFQRVYDLTERVLPAWVDTTLPTDEERDCHWIEAGVRALGVCTPSQAGDYTYRKLTVTRRVIEKLLADGIIVPIEGQLSNGKTESLLVHRDNLPVLQQAADGALAAQRTTFLSPFDSLWWAKRRDVQLWGFRQSLEAYLPAPKRTYGYFCLAILHRDRLVGRFDPKLERKTGTLRLKALYLESGIEPDETLVGGVTAAMRDFMAFHGARELVIERSQPAEFGQKLLAEI